MRASICLLLILLMLVSAFGSKESKNEDNCSNFKVEETAKNSSVQTGEYIWIPQHEVFTEGDYEFEKFHDETCKIVHCSSNELNIIVPETLQEHTVIGIGRFAFMNCEAESITLPNTVEYIEASAFHWCPNLKHVEFGSGLKRIGLLAFNFCPKLESLHFPDGMKEMDGVCISGCENLQEVYIPDSVTVIVGGIAYHDLCPKMVVVTPECSAARLYAEYDGLPVKSP